SPTDDGDVHTGVVVVLVFSGEGPLGPFVDADVVLQRRELLPKLRLVELLHEEGRAPRVLRFRLAPELKSTDGVAWSPGGYICGALGFCCQRAKRVPEGSSKMENHPWPGTSFFGSLTWNSTCTIAPGFGRSAMMTPLGRSKRRGYLTMFGRGRGKYENYRDVRGAPQSPLASGRAKMAPFLRRRTQWPSRIL